MNFGAIRESRTLVLTAVGIVTLILLASILRNPDQRRIYRRFDRLVRLVEKKDDEKPITALTKTAAILDAFTATASVNIDAPGPSTFGREEFAGAVQHVRGAAQRIHVRVHDRSLVVAADRASALMDVTIEGTVEFRAEKAQDIREYEIEWVRQDGKWLIQRVAPAQTIRRPSTVER